MISNLLFISLGYIILSFAHPFHASVCEIEYNENSHSLEISYRMFLDDLEEAINKKYNEKVDILKPDQKDKVDELVEKYLKEQMKYSVNEQAVEFEYLGSEIEGYALWCFIEVPDVEMPKTLEVENGVLLELFDDQINLVHFNKEDKVRSLKLFKDNSRGILDLSGL